jgi:hypothetical protein
MNHKFIYNDQYFNIPTDAPAQNQFGYYYKPHNSITLRVYSDYIEEGDATGVLGIPDYAFFSNLSNSFRWRDLYPYGYVDTSGIGVDYPFLNGAHYPFKDILFLQYPVRRDNNVQSTQINRITNDDCE